MQIDWGQYFEIFSQAQSQEFQKVNSPYQKLYRRMEPYLWTCRHTLMKWKQILSSQNLDKIQFLLMQIHLHFQRFIHNGSIIENFPLRNMSKECKRLSNQLTNARKEKMKQKTSQQFQKLFEPDKITILDKEQGTQQGCKIRLKLKNSKTVNYFCKYHIKFMSSEPQEIERVDLKQIFVYKLLQLLDIGPQTHLYYFNMEHFFISTKDSASSQNQESSAKFLTFEQILSEPFKNVYLEKFKDGFTQLNLITKLLSLQDTIYNFTNFGFIFTSKTEPKLQIIDSFPPPICRQQYFMEHEKYLKKNIFQQWLQDIVQYSGQDADLIAEILKPSLIKRQQRSKDRCIYMKLTQAESVIKKIISKKLPSCVQEARRFLINLLKDPILNVEYVELLDLDKYIKAINTNYESFMRDYSFQLKCIEEVKKMKFDIDQFQI